MACRRHLPGVSTERGFAEFYAATWPRLLRTTYVVAGDRQLAEDALQTAYAKAFASWGRVSRADDPVAYLRRMAVNAALTPATTAATAAPATTLRRHALRCCARPGRSFRPAHTPRAWTRSRWSRPRSVCSSRAGIRRSRTTATPPSSRTSSVGTARSGPAIPRPASCVGSNIGPAAGSSPRTSRAQQASAAIAARGSLRPGDRRVPAAQRPGRGGLPPGGMVTRRR
ncbi:MAG: hypothetical protein M3237_15560 [Actinomycetota bacterium]|nr:hypothetical protein [Actinomycetota bacterium]